MMNPDKEQTSAPDGNSNAKEVTGENSADKLLMRKVESQTSHSGAPTYASSITKSSIPALYNTDHHQTRGSRRSVSKQSKIFSAEFILTLKSRPRETSHPIAPA